MRERESEVASDHNAEVTAVPLYLGGTAEIELFLFSSVGVFSVPRGMILGSFWSVLHGVQLYVVVHGPPH